MNPLSFNARLESIEGPMAHHVIVVPAEIAKQFVSGKGAVRILCAIGDTAEFHCALNPRHGEHVIIASKQLIKAHKLLTGMPFRMSIRIDPHNGLALPEELSEVFNQDEFACEVYQALPDGEKRGLIYYIRQAKSMDTRIKRSLEMMEKLKQRS